MGLNWDWGGFARGVAGSLAQEYSPQMRMLRPLREAQTRLADAQSGLAHAQAGAAEAQLRGLQSLVEMLPGWIEYSRTGKLPDETPSSATSPDVSPPVSAALPSEPVSFRPTPAPTPRGGLDRGLIGRRVAQGIGQGAARPSQPAPLLRSIQRGGAFQPPGRGTTTPPSPILSALQRGRTFQGVPDRRGTPSPATAQVSQPSPPIDFSAGVDLPKGRTVNIPPSMPRDADMRLIFETVAELAGLNVDISKVWGPPQTNPDYLQALNIREKRDNQWIEEMISPKMTKSEEFSPRGLSYHVDVPTASLGNPNYAKDLAAWQRNLAERGIMPGGTISSMEPDPSTQVGAWKVPPSGEPSAELTNIMTGESLNLLTRQNMQDEEFPNGIQILSSDRTPGDMVAEIGPLFQGEPKEAQNILNEILANAPAVDEDGWPIFGSIMRRNPQTNVVERVTRKPPDAPTLRGLRELPRLYRVVQEVGKIAQGLNWARTGPGAKALGMAHKVGAWSGLSQEAIKLDRVRMAFASVFAQLANEVGRLTDLDVKRALNQIPDMFLTKDTTTWLLDFAVDMLNERTVAVTGFDIGKGFPKVTIDTPLLGRDKTAGLGIAADPETGLPIQ